MVDLVNGRVRIDELINAARVLAFTQPEESLRLLDEAIEVAIQANEFHHLALAYETRGTVCINAGRVQDAYTYYQHAGNTMETNGICWKH